jgi:hypothetical protein
MTIAPPSGAGKSQDTAPERARILTALNIAVTRSRLEATQLQTIFHALRQKDISCAEALAQIKAEGLLARLPFGQGAAR